MFEVISSSLSCIAHIGSTRVAFQFTNYRFVVMSQDLSTVIGGVEGSKIHSKTHTRKFNCNLCQRQFNRREHLQRHQSIREQENPF